MKLATNIYHASLQWSLHLLQGFQGQRSRVGGFHFNRHVRIVLLYRVISEL